MNRPDLRIACFLLVSALPWLSACGPTADDASNRPEDQAQAPDDVPEDVLATFQGGRLTFDDFDRAMLAMPAAQRQTLTLGESDAYRLLAEELALDDILLQEARLLGFDQSPEFLEQRRALWRSHLMERYSAEHLPEPTPPTEAELAEELELRKDEFQRRERRLIFNLFRRLEPGGSKDALEAEVEALRQQVLDGQGFSALATRFSDSETRHHRGELGWFERGQLSPELEEVVFSLEEGIPSRPIRTADGVHLFLVDVVIEGKDFSMDEIQKTLQNRWFERRREEALQELEDTLPEVDLFVPSADELRRLMQRGNPGATVLRVGDYVLRLDDFLLMLENDTAQRPNVNAPRTEQLLTAVRRAERVYQHLLDTETELDPEGVLEAQEARLLAFAYRQQKLQQRLEAQNDSLRGFFEDNRMRFTSPLRVRLRILSLPKGNEASQHMAVLERRREALDAKDHDLETLAPQLGGRVEDLDWQTLAQLRLASPRLAQFVPTVAVGQHSPPYSTPDGLHIVRVLERQDPQPLPYEQVVEAVRSAYLERHGQRLYQELRQESLETAGFQFFDGRFEAWLRTGLAGGSSTN